MTIPRTSNILSPMPKPAYERFDSKSENYEKGRPEYPQEAIRFLCEQLNLTYEMTIVDIGAGTGLLTKTLQNLFSRVIAVEPNDEMRERIDGLKIKGTSEDTKLLDKSVNCILAAQAFHWFDIEKTRKEFQRVLKAPYAVGLLWNERHSNGDAGVQELDQLMKRLRGDGGHKLEADASSIKDFFQISDLQFNEFPNPVELTRVSFNAMVLSRSYAPKKGTNEYEHLVTELGALFDKYAAKNKFKVPYVTRVYWGFLSPRG